MWPLTLCINNFVFLPLRALLHIISSAVREKNEVKGAWAMSGDPLSDITLVLWGTRVGLMVRTCGIVAIWLWCVCAHVKFCPSLRTTQTAKLVVVKGRIVSDVLRIRVAIWRMFPSSSSFRARAPLCCRAKQGNRVNFFIFFRRPPTAKGIRALKSLVDLDKSSRSHESVKTGTTASVKWGRDLHECHALSGPPLFILHSCYQSRHYRSCVVMERIEWNCFTQDMKQKVSEEFAR